MKVGTLSFDGVEYAVIPMAEYLRLVEKERLEEAVPFARASLAKDLKAARLHAGLSQKALAAKLKLSQSRVSSIESGKKPASPDYVQRLLKVCKLPPDWRAPSTQTKK